MRYTIFKYVEKIQPNFEIAAGWIRNVRNQDNETTRFRDLYQFHFEISLFFSVVGRRRGGKENDVKNHKEGKIGKVKGDRGLVDHAASDHPHQEEVGGRRDSGPRPEDVNDHLGPRPQQVNDHLRHHRSTYNRAYRDSGPYENVEGRNNTQQVDQNFF